ncbi:hypothetical protein LINPERPRIM_LOCUS28455, partial [Linum perenne]
EIHQTILTISFFTRLALFSTRQSDHLNIANILTSSRRRVLPQQSLCRRLQDLKQLRLKRLGIWGFLCFELCVLGQNLGFLYVKIKPKFEFFDFKVGSTEDWKSRSVL